MKLTFVVLHYRDAVNTRACIDSLCEMRPVKNCQIEIIIIDNASPDPFPKDEIRCALGEIIIVRNDKNIGYSGGMNSGIHIALGRGADFIAVVNNDTIFEKSFLAALVQEASEKKHGIFVPKIYFYPGTEFHHGRYKEKERGKVIWYAGGTIDWSNILASHRGVDEVDFGQYDKEEETVFATGCCIVFPRQILEAVGMFDDRYFLYFEDIDMSQRVKRAGYKIYFVPDAVVWHKNAKSSGGPGSNLQDYFIARNRLLFGFQYASKRAKLALFRESLGDLIHGRTWQKKGIIDFYLRRLGKGSYPIQ